eukprot:SAG11_NODE_27133_length_336_cov_0.911392_1_plen_56_part_10
MAGDPIQAWTSGPTKTNRRHANLGSLQKPEFDGTLEHKFLLDSVLHKSWLTKTELQ